MQASQYAFTVLTTTYNRVDVLKRAYASLAAQSYRDFEWLVVDDGSTDATREQVLAWVAESAFPIRYVWQENAHKKTAFNHGVREARGELLVVLDDDDELTRDTLSRLKKIWDGIGDEQRGNFIGVTGLCARPDGKVVGDLFPADVFDCPAAEMALKHRVRGEKFGCQRVDVLRQFPFPEDVPGFVPESFVWWAISRAGYLNRFVNQVVRVYHPTPGSLSDRRQAGNRHAVGLYLLNWITLQHHAGSFWYDPMTFTMTAARLTRFARSAQAAGHGDVLRRYPLTQPFSRLMVWLTWPLGWALYERHKRQRGSQAA